MITLTKLKTRRCSLFAASLLLGSLTTQAQLTVGSTGLYITGSTIVSTDSLVLQPATDVLLSDLQVTRVATPLSGANGQSIRRVYQFSQPLTFTGTLGMYYADQDLNGNAEANLAFVYQQSADSIYKTVPGSLDMSNNYLTFPMTGIPIKRISATENGVLLPVTITAFTALTATDKVQLDWQTSFEHHNDRFEIERATDGSHYAVIATVQATNKTQGDRYSAYDRQPLAGINYYRLVQYDANGAATYQGVRTVRFGANAALTFTAFPNPATTGLTLRVNNHTGGRLQLTLLTVQGIPVYKTAINLQPGRSNYSLPVKVMPPKGSYLLQVAGQGIKQVIKITLQ